MRGAQASEEGVSHVLEQLCFQEIPRQVSRLSLELVPRFWPNVGNTDSPLWYVYCFWFSYSRAYLQCDLIGAELRIAFCSQLEVTNPLVESGEQRYIIWQARGWGGEFFSLLSLLPAASRYSDMQHIDPQLITYSTVELQVVICKMEWCAMLFRLYSRLVR